MHSIGCYTKSPNSWEAPKVSDAKLSLGFIYSCKTSETLSERYCLLHLTLNPIRTQPRALPVIISWRQLSAWHPSLTGSVTNGVFRKLICRNKPWLICQWVKCYQFGQAWERYRLTHVARLLNGFTFRLCNTINCCRFSRDPNNMVIHFLGNAVLASDESSGLIGLGVQACLVLQFEISQPQNIRL